MNTQKSINILLIASIVLSILFPVISFFYFNRDREVLVEINHPTNLMFNIDSCSVSNKRASIAGWVTPEAGSYSNPPMIIIIDKVGKKFLIPYMQVRRPDVSKKNGKPRLYDKAGFKGTILINGRFEPSDKFIIGYNHNGVAYGESYTCK